MRPFEAAIKGEQPGWSLFWVAGAAPFSAC